MAQLQLSAISDLDYHSIDASSISSASSLIDSVANLSIEVSLLDEDNKLHSSKMSLSNLLSAIASYVGDQFVQISGETRTFAPGNGTPNSTFIIAPQGEMIMKTTTTLTLSADTSINSEAQIQLDPSNGKVIVVGNEKGTNVGAIDAVATHALWS